MIGWRGASRYYDPRFSNAFSLECQAIKKTREIMDFSNVVPMVPFCRTVQEAKNTLAIMRKNSLIRGKNGLKIYVMAEIPTNAIQADKFLDLFDGMSIGSNDLTQLVVGLDRDSGQLAHIANENNQAVKIMIKTIIDACNKRKKYVGICGQAPSDYPEFAKFLKKLGIQAISLNPDSVVKTIIALAKK
jgi:pyruvate,water dikinase